MINRGKRTARPVQTFANGRFDRASGGQWEIAAQNRCVMYCQVRVSYKKFANGSLDGAVARES